MSQELGIWDNNPVDENGWWHGPWRSYYHTGRLMYEATYDHGRLHGLVHKFSPGGTLLVECEWNQGLPCGIMTTHHCDGRVTTERHSLWRGVAK